VAALTGELFPLATVVTPNLSEAEVLVRFPVQDVEAMEEAARAIARLGPKAVVVKGGHLSGDAVDVLYDGRRMHRLVSARLATVNVHGTGCTFASALAAELAKGCGVLSAVRTAKRFVTVALKAGYRLGAGPGTGNPMAWLRG
jgi:hydroxymethylpyrimidine/phosphomethylpyrimidine kinase